MNKQSKQLSKDELKKRAREKADKLLKQYVEAKIALFKQFNIELPGLEVT